MSERTEVEDVRERPEKARKLLRPTTRVKVRIDYLRDTGDLDYSLVAWDHPEGILVANRLWRRYDPYHAGMAPADLVANIVTALGLDPEPFP